MFIVPLLFLARYFYKKANEDNWKDMLINFILLSTLILTYILGYIISFAETEVVGRIQDILIFGIFLTSLVGLICYRLYMIFRNICMKKFQKNEPPQKELDEVQ